MWCMSVSNWLRSEHSLRSATPPDIRKGASERSDFNSIVSMYDTWLWKISS